MPWLAGKGFLNLPEDFKMTSVYFFRLGCGIPWLSWREKQPWNRPAKWPARHVCHSPFSQQTAHTWRSMLLECHASKPQHDWNPHLCFVALSCLPLSGLAGWKQLGVRGYPAPMYWGKGPDRHWSSSWWDPLKVFVCAVVVQGGEMWVEGGSWGP